MLPIEVRREIAMRHLALANAANLLRPCTKVVKLCRRCGAEMKVKKSHEHRRFYCSKECASRDYETRLRGSANPNFRNLPAQTCIGCGGDFHSYVKTRKYCSHSCYLRRETERWWNEGMRANRRDQNHAEIVKTFTDAGGGWLDLADVGRGCPDGVLGLCRFNVLVEIKNPKSQYGKKGLSPTQLKWEAEWKGGKVQVVETREDALALMRLVRHAAAEWAAGREEHALELLGRRPRI